MSIDGPRRGSREPFAGNMPSSEVLCGLHFDGLSDSPHVFGAWAEAVFVAPLSDCEMKVLLLRNDWVGNT